MIEFQKVIMGVSEDVRAIIVICLVAMLGIRLGKIKIFNISLGITFVFFVGIVVGHFDLNINQTIIKFAQSAGLVLFIYALGLQVGPGFFSSLKSSGLGLNLLALLVIFLGLGFTILFSFIFNIPISNMTGVMCGAVTNTPALGAAQEALISSIPNTPSKELADMAMATAITYPMGVIGVIFALIFLRKVLSNNTTTHNNEIGTNDKEPFIGEFVIANEGINGKTVKDLMSISSRKFIISRVRKKDKILLAKSDTTLEMGDDLMIACNKNDVPHITALLGKIVDKDWNSKQINWEKIDNSSLTSKKIVITQDHINGKKLGNLKLRNNYGINITRIERVGILLLATPNLALQIGDVVTVVGENSEINKVSKILGNSVKRLDNPNLIGVFLGAAIGLILGSIPFFLPGISFPVKLGIAGGPIIVGILMGAFGPKFKITTYTTPSSNLFMREFGLVIYLACLGISSGEHFFETIFTMQGLLWIALGFLITTLPLLICGIIAMKSAKLDYATSLGMLCGAMSNPIALNYGNSELESDQPSISYATVYPVSIFIRIITAQMLILFFA